MARIDLKDATIRLLDGFSATADINDTPVNGMTVMNIDNVSAAIRLQPGTRFTMADTGTKQYHIASDRADEIQNIFLDTPSAGTFTLTFSAQETGTIAFDATAATIQTALEALSNLAVGDVIVTASGADFLVRFAGTLAATDVAEMTIDGTGLTGAGSEAITTINVGGTTEQITFTPALATADGIPDDDDVITFGPHSLEVNIGEGDLSYTENKERIYERNRGNLADVRDGDEQPVEVNFAFTWDEIAAIPSAQTPSIEDVLKFRGPASTWVSSDPDPCQPNAIDLEVLHEPSCTTKQKERVLLPDFRYEQLEHSYEDAIITSTGRCNVVEATVTREV